MSDLKVTYSGHTSEPMLEGSRLNMPNSDLTWEHLNTKCNNVHLVVKFDRKNMLPDGAAPFLKWIFYVQASSIWAEVGWDTLIEKHKMAVFNAVLAQHQWLPFYKQDVLPPWEDGLFVLAALGQA